MSWMVFVLRACADFTRLRRSAVLMTSHQNLDLNKEKNKKKKWFLKEVSVSRNSNRILEIKFVLTDAGKDCASSGPLLKPKDRV